MKKHLILLVFSLLLFNSCNILTNENASSTKFLIGFSQINSVEPWRQSMNNEFEREVFFHKNIEFIMEDANFSTQDQIADIRSLADRNVDLLIVSPQVSGPITEVIVEMNEHGIPVILLDRKVNTEKYTAFVGADNFKIGYQAGKLAAEMLNGKGRILEIRGLSESSPASGRHNGFTNALENYSNIEIVNGGDGHWLAENTENLVRELFKSDREFDLVYAHNDVMAVAVNKVASGIGVDIPFYIGVDALPGPEGGIQMVKEGILDATFEYPRGSSEAIHIAKDILTGKSFEKENTLNSIAVTKENVDIIISQANRLMEDQRKIELQQKILADQLIRINSQKDALYIIGLAAVLLLIAIGLTVRLFFISKKQNKELNRNNEQLVFLNNKLQESEAELKELNATKDKLFSIISHDLKNPFNIILNASKELDEEYDTFSEEERTEYIHMIREETVSSYSLLENLLHWSRAQRGALKVSKEVQNAEILVKKGISNSLQGAENKGIKLISDVDASLRVFVDDTMIITVIRNLVSNAIKFTVQGGEVKVSAHDLNDGNIEFSISDTGIGISEDKIPKLFKVNEHVSTPGTSNEPGTGLGLIICKEFVEKNGGQIWVESEPEKGTTFHFTVPHK